MFAYGIGNNTMVVQIQDRTQINFVYFYSNVVFKFRDIC